MARRYGMPSKYSRSTDHFIDGLFKVGKSMASAYEREAKRQQREQAKQVVAYERAVAQSERERTRQIKQHEMALRRAEREREKAERAKEKEAKLQAKKEEQLRVEAELTEIEDNNYLWTNVHSFIDSIVTLDKVNKTIVQCNQEFNNKTVGGFFKTPYPSDSEAKEKAKFESTNKFNVVKAQKEYEKSLCLLNELKFNEVEPTADSVSEELMAEAKERINSFLPWKKSKLRKAYVAENQESRYLSKHNEWLTKKEEYNTRKTTLAKETEEKQRIVVEIKQKKEDFFNNRVKELYGKELSAWEKDREGFYNTFLQSLQNVKDGGRDYIITAISSLFPDDELPMEYFVDFTYEEENGRVMVDLDLPEIEDLPDKKIVLTPTGKKSARMKSKTDLRSDYAHCVFSLAIYVAYSIFNVSLKIEEIEISGFTQRKETNSAVATDQYIFLVSFTRNLFSEMDFSKLSSVQIMDFFKHNYNMSKNFDMKQLNLGKAYEEMESFVPADYQSFMYSNH